MATLSKRVLFLERLRSDRTAWRFLMWASVPAAIQDLFANPSLRSAYQRISPGDLLLLQSGAVTERVEEFSADDPNMTLGGIRNEMEARWAAFQAEINALAAVYNRYGQYWDGTSWITSPPA